MPGYKEFSDLQIFTAENFMDYIMKQVVITCDNTTNRDSGLSTYLREGMACYMKDTDQLVVYDGSSWIRLATYAEATSTYDPRDNDIVNNMYSLISG